MGYAHDFRNLRREINGLQTDFRNFRTDFRSLLGFAEV